MNTYYKLKIIKTNTYEILCMKDCSIVVFIIPYGYRSIERYPGYVHLLEHMILRSNAAYKKDMENVGVYCNAQTNEYTMLFIFYDINNNVLTEAYISGEIMKFFQLLDFETSQLEYEKKVILQEYLYLLKKYSPKDVQQSIGTKEEITGFDLNTLNDIKNEIIQINNIKKILIKGGKRKEEFQLESILHHEWYYNINVIECKQGENIEIKVSKNHWTNMFLFCLRILYLDVDNIVRYDIQLEEQTVLIRVFENVQELIKRLNKKKLFYSRYLLLLDSYKFLISDIIYSVLHIEHDINVEEAFLDEPWDAYLISILQVK